MGVLRGGIEMDVLREEMLKTLDGVLGLYDKRSIVLKDHIAKIRSKNDELVACKDELMNRVCELEEKNRELERYVSVLRRKQLEENHSEARWHGRYRELQKAYSLATAKLKACKDCIKGEEAKKEAEKEKEKEKDSGDCLGNCKGCSFPDCIVDIGLVMWE